MLSVESWAILGGVVILSWYYVHRKWQYLKKLGIPHDPPSIFKLGHILDGFGKTKGFKYDAIQKKKHGPIYGGYAGVSPCICIHDPDILRQVFIKEFHKFPNRQVRLNKINGKELNQSLTAVTGPQWKRIRTTLTPTFSTAKLRQMSGIIEWCTGNAIEAFNRKIRNTGGIFNAKEIFSRLSLDIICSAAFSTKVDSQDDTVKEPEISKQGKKLFSGSIFSPLVLLCLICPPFEDLIAKFDISLFGRGALEYFKSLTNMVIERREENPHQMGGRVDLMQLMLNSKVDEDELAKGVEKGMTRTEIMGNSILMILAGYENTANAISHLAYSLAFYPEKQKKVQEEVDEMMKTHGKFDYDAVASMKYLDMCVNETLRLYHPTLRNIRMCEQDVTINGLYIPKGVHVIVPAYALAHDPEYWDEPFEFKPERFEDMSQIDPMMFQPFGAGPRNCIAMRFALMEVKLAMAKLLHNFTFVPAEDTPKPPLELCFTVSVRPVVNYNLKVTKRQKEE